MQLEQSRFSTRRLVLASLALAMLGLGGCAHHGPPPATPEALSTPAPETAPAATTTTSSATLNVSNELAQACKLDVGSVQRAPKFDFDMSALEPQDRQVLDQIAKCVTTGPLRGRHLHLVGRADPRGEVEYNMVLGASRADSVENYLVGLGVDGTTLTKTSRGKLDATGTNEEGWRLDRRVDVDLQ